MTARCTRHCALDERIEAATDVTLPAGECVEVLAHRRVAFSLGDLRIVAGEEARMLGAARASLPWASAWLPRSIVSRLCHARRALLLLRHMYSPFDRLHHAWCARLWRAKLQRVRPQGKSPRAGRRLALSSETAYFRQSGASSAHVLIAERYGTTGTFGTSRNCLFDRAWLRHEWRRRQAPASRRRRPRAGLSRAPACSSSPTSGTSPTTRCHSSGSSSTPTRSTSRGYRRLPRCGSARKSRRRSRAA